MSAALVDLVQTIAREAQTMTAEKAWDLLINSPVYYEKWWINLLRESPQHVLIETSLIVFIIWLLFIRRTVDPKKSTNSPKLSQKEIEWLIETWEPEPLAGKISATDRLVLDNTKVIEKLDGDYLTLRGVHRQVLNAASFDFLCFGQSEEIKQVARDALEKYGCGSCGPRGFYGTIDTHINLEKEMADFMEVQETILYSDGSSTVSSVIPAFSKKGDLLIVDEACSEPIMTGVNLSRSTVKYFKHNDMADLRRLLEAVAADDKRSRRDTAQQRRFIIVEGLYRSTGELCPLPELMQIKEQFFYRLVLDETMSFGVFGRTGRGLLEHFNIARDRVEAITITLDTVLSSCGGLCMGNRELIDHQRLSGAGYCYSASTAPYLVASASAGLRKLVAEGPQLVTALHERCVAVHQALKGLSTLQVVSKDPTPVVHLVLKQPLARRDEEIALLVQVVDHCVQDGVGVVLSKYAVKFSAVRPSIMLCVHSSFDDSVVASIARVLESASRKVAK